MITVILHSLYVGTIIAFLSIQPFVSLSILTRVAKRVAKRVEGSILFISYDSAPSS